MKGKPPSKYFTHDGTFYSLTGNKRLAMSHFHEVRSHWHLLKMVNVHKLPIISGIKEFDDGTVAHFQGNYEIEKIKIYAPEQVPTEEVIEKSIIEEYERIIPCMIVTGEEYGSEEILGYIACLSGSFRGPYKYFAADSNDDELVIEGFLLEGHPDYIEDLAISNRKKLSIDPEEVGFDKLLFYKPSGITSDDYIQDDEGEWIARIDSGEYWTTKGETETAGDPTPYIEESSWETFLYWWDEWFNPMTRYGADGWDLLFDGIKIADQYSNDTSEHGHWQCGSISVACTSLFGDVIPPSCYESAQEWFSSYTPPDNLMHDGGDNPMADYYYDIYSTNHYYGTELLDAIYICMSFNDDSLISSAILLEHDHRITTAHSWDLWTRPPLPPGEPGNKGDVVSSDTLKSLQLSIDNRTRFYDVTEELGWDYYQKYTIPVNKCSIVYDKKNMQGNSITLASVMKRPNDGTFEQMAFLYEGSAADALEGCATFPITIGTNDYGWNEYYVDSLEAVSNNVSGKIRGHVFLGIIVSQQEIKIR